ncbi:hypothetical protein [Streptomyces sp. CBMA123]|uniref:hypothetical protein n=1 Tax=Streptomyces sp. CBMA123 TaxID=1896313 RepID=UPI0016621B5E|nr:hypothetical protein [Streptomyces sp. CBMA123]
MSGTIPPGARGRWRDQRGRDLRGPTRVPKHPTLPQPGQIPADSENEEETMTPQKGPGGDDNNGVGGAPPTPPDPANPPPSSGRCGVESGRTPGSGTPNG